MTQDHLSDPFNESNMVKPNFMKFGKIGDYIVGTLTNRNEVKDKFSKENKNKIQYTVKVDVGEYHDPKTGEVVTLEPGAMFIVTGKAFDPNQASRSIFDQDMATLKLGQKLGLKFLEEKDTGAPQPAKIIKLFTYKDPNDPTKKLMDKEWMVDEGLIMGEGEESKDVQESFS